MADGYYFFVGMSVIEQKSKYTELLIFNHNGCISIRLVYHT